ncbi:BA14K family protein [Hoeflea sp. AS16]|uniref:BA14K family protein n=1 Tax=unclassified Hoeflea TaxID=2614931 RepID=UPI0031811A2B
MNMFAKKFGIALLTAATAFTPLTTGIANAGEAEFRDPNQPHLYRPHAQRWDRSNRGHRSHRRNHDNNDAIALGILGLGAAAIIGGAIANSNNPRVIYRQPTNPRAVSGGDYEPWSRSWYRYCANKYRSFNASTGTYRGYDGRDHFCVVR